MIFKTITGSSEFHVAIITRNAEKFMASPRPCMCSHAECVWSLMEHAHSSRLTSLTCKCWKLLPWGTTCHLHLKLLARKRWTYLLVWWPSLRLLPQVYRYRLGGWSFLDHQGYKCQQSWYVKWVCRQFRVENCSQSHSPGGKFSRKEWDWRRWRRRGTIYPRRSHISSWRASYTPMSTSWKENVVWPWT